MNETTPRRRYPEVAAELHDYIKENAFGIDDKLPAERDLAERFGVSRALLREALIMLEIQGLIEVRKGSGVYVAFNEPMLHNTDNDIGPFELLQARQVLESSIAEVAAHTITKRDLDDLQVLLNQQTQEIKDNNTDYKTDELFHLRIAQATQNSVLEESVVMLWQMRHRSPMWAQLHSHITDTTYWRDWINDHQTIFNALKRKDGTAARHAMWQHLENVRKTVLALSDTDTPDFDGYLFQSLPLTGAH